MADRAQSEGKPAPPAAVPGPELETEATAFRRDRLLASLVLVAGASFVLARSHWCRRSNGSSGGEFRRPWRP
jgi:hypothetical protein